MKWNWNLWSGKYKSWINNVFNYYISPFNFNFKWSDKKFTNKNRNDTATSTSNGYILNDFLFYFSSLHFHSKTITTNISSRPNQPFVINFALIFISIPPTFLQQLYHFSRICTLYVYIVGCLAIWSTVRLDVLSIALPCPVLWQSIDNHKKVNNIRKEMIFVMHKDKRKTGRFKRNSIIPAGLHKLSILCISIIYKTRQTHIIVGSGPLWRVDVQE